MGAIPNLQSILGLEECGGGVLRQLNLNGSLLDTKGKTGDGKTRGDSDTEILQGTTFLKAYHKAYDPSEGVTWLEELGQKDRNVETDFLGGEAGNRRCVGESKKVLLKRREEDNKKSGVKEIYSLAQSQEI